MYLLSCCLTPCDSMDCSTPGSSVHGIFSGKNPGMGFISYSRGSSWPRDWTCISGEGNSNPLQYSCPGKFHGQRSLVGCSPWAPEESDKTEQFHFHFSLSCIGEEMATHSSVLAWRIPGTGEPGELPSMGSHRVGHDWSDLAAAAAASAAPASAGRFSTTESPGKPHY